MTSVAATARVPHAHHDDRSFVRKYIFSTDHKIIGIQFLFVSLFFLLLGGVLAMQMRWQLAFPGQPMPGGGILPDTMAPGIGCPGKASCQRICIASTPPSSRKNRLTNRNWMPMIL